jgi:MoxR-like ATPase
MEIKGQITKLLDDLNKGVYEKQEVIALTLLTAVAGESIFLLGAPGVAKSLIARRLKFGFKDGTSFEYLMNRFSTPDEIFGPVSISQLKDHDKYERIIKNYLPSATVVFLDEIWKAGPSIQNALLTVLNEKVYRNGDQEIKVPMKALISASNELPMKGEGLEALWDRFLVRYVVDGITDKDSFNEMISKSLNSYEDNVSAALKLTDDQYNKISEEIDKVEIPENVFNVVHIIRNYIDQHNKKDEKQENQIYISDRRWRKIVRLLRTSAFLNDRKAVDLMDCFLIAHCIWNEPTQFASVLQFTKDAIQKHGYKLEIDLKDLKEELDDFDVEVKNYCNDNRKEAVEIPKVYYSEFYNIATLSRPLIRTNDFNNLNGEYVQIPFYLNSSDSYDRRNYYEHYTIKASNKPNHIVLDGKLHKIEVDEKEEIVPYTRKPRPRQKIDWDKRIKVLLTKFSNLKSQIDHYRKNDLQHLSVNLFVNPNLAEIVETNLNDTQKEIEKLEIEANSIQHYYENIEDQSTPQEIKQLSSGKV